MAFDVVSIAAKMRVLCHKVQVQLCEREGSERIGTYDIWAMISDSGKRSSSAASMFDRTIHHKLLHALQTEEAGSRGTY